MRSNASALAFIGSIFASCATVVCASETSDLCYAAVFAEDSAAREVATSALREMGPSALEPMFDLRSKLQYVASGSPEAAKRSVAQWSLRRLDRAIDQVGGQRYCTVSRLYWYTDFAAAKAAAQASGKPILSLRMLGKLTEEYSCANSRFFRTTLYANEEISRTLRENFILHWQSVRPVPVVTVDFGDGRVLKRTLTGNSAHYLLAPDGRPLDVLPGLYHPQAFQAWLASGQALAQSYMATQPWDHDALLRSHHQRQQSALLAAWRKELAKIGAAPPTAQAQQKAQGQAHPRAEAAALVAVTKFRVEAPILRHLDLAISQQANQPTAADLASTTREEHWQKIAALQRYKVNLDAASRELIRRELRTDETAASKTIRALEDSLALDTVRNEYRLHSRIHQWFAAGEADADVAALNERVYAELFLTPSSDPWLGLAPGDVYTALDNAGVDSKP